MERTAPEKLDILSRVEQHALIREHDSLAMKVAAKFTRTTDLPIEDMAQEGRLGLVIAARHFDPARGFQFSTYAGHWIRACILDYIVKQTGQVRIPSGGVTRKIFFQLGRARTRCWKEGREATPEAMAAIIGVPASEVEQMLPRMTRGDVSLNADEAGEQPLSNRLAGPVTPGLDETDWHEAVMRRIRRATAKMKWKYRRVFEMRFTGEESKTLSEIGKTMQISRERVRQMELIIVRQLRKHLQDLVEVEA